MDLSDLKSWFENLKSKLSDKEIRISEEIIKEINDVQKIYSNPCP